MAKTIRFTGIASPYWPGDVCSFDDATAGRYVRAGFAVEATPSSAAAVSKEASTAPPPADKRVRDGIRKPAS